MSTEKVATDTTNEQEFDNNMDDYENMNETSKADEDQDAEDSLAAMKRRVAAIEAEAAKISAMSAVDNDDNLGKASSLTPQKSQSNEPNTNNNNDNMNKKASSIDVDGKSNDQKENAVEPPKKDGDENWPSSIEEQEELDSRSVFIKNVDNNTDANELKAHFESCGTIERVTIPFEKWSQKPKGIAYIQFKSQESVAAACLLNDKEFNGRIIQVLEKRTNLPMWLRNKRGRGRGRGYRGRGYGGYRGRSWGGYGGYRGRGGYYGGWAPYPYPY